MNLSLTIISPRDVVLGIAERARERRLEVNLTQSGLAARAQVSLGTLKHFERTGKASFECLSAIAFALGAEQEVEGLFPSRPVKRVEDVILKPRRVRGRRR